MIDFPHEATPLALTTPFEDWCDLVGTHPEDPDAWTFYARSVGIEDHAPAAS